MASTNTYLVAVLAVLAMLVVVIAFWVGRSGARPATTPAPAPLGAPLRAPLGGAPRARTSLGAPKRMQSWQSPRQQPRPEPSLKELLRAQTDVLTALRGVTKVLKPIAQDWNRHTLNQAHVMETAFNEMIQIYATAKTPVQFDKVFFYQTVTKIADRIANLGAMLPEVILKNEMPPSAWQLIQPLEAVSGAMARFAVLYSDHRHR